MRRYTIISTLCLMLAGFFLAFAVGRVCASEATITYSFEGVHHGAFHDAKVHWNQAASRSGAPILARARPGERPDYEIRAQCLSHRTDAFTAQRRLVLNRCNYFTPEERRSLYSHELGHVYGLPHASRRGPGTVMTGSFPQRIILYPTTMDVRELERRWR